MQTNLTSSLPNCSSDFQILNMKMKLDINKREREEIKKHFVHIMLIILTKYKLSYLSI